MPWKESTHVNERMKFVLRLENGERMSDLCEEYGISRKTGYKFLGRYKQSGPRGLYDLSKRPKRLAREVPFEIQKLILDVKREKPTWGAAKIHEIVRRRFPTHPIPVRSTIHELLDRHGYVKKRSRIRRFRAYPTGLSSPAESPNVLWSADFKGQFRMQNSRYCYPLTVTDHATRYLLGCEALESTQRQGTLPVFEAIFQEHGLPQAIRTDNGPPFSSRSVMGLSKLSAWWMRLGIRLERIEPGHPEQNGRHERMHLTLKNSATQPSARNLLQQQEKLDEFRVEFNTQRPHEAIGMKTPGELYKPSARAYPAELPEPNYADCDLVRPVSDCGQVRFEGKNRCFFLSEALGGQRIGLTEEEDSIWRVSFMDLDLGFLDAQSLKFAPRQPEESPSRPSRGK